MQADGRAQMNIECDAWGSAPGGGSKFPAQIRVTRTVHRSTSFASQAKLREGTLSPESTSAILQYIAKLSPPTKDVPGGWTPQKPTLQKSTQSNKLKGGASRQNGERQQPQPQQQQPPQKQQQKLLQQQQQMHEKQEREKQQVEREQRKREQLEKQKRARELQEQQAEVSRQEILAGGHRRGDVVVAAAKLSWNLGELTCNEGEKGTVAGGNSAELFVNFTGNRSNLCLSPTDIHSLGDWQRKQEALRLERLPGGFRRGDAVVTLEHYAWADGARLNIGDRGKISGAYEGKLHVEFGEPVGPVDLMPAAISSIADWERKQDALRQDALRKQEALPGGFRPGDTVVARVHREVWSSSFFRPMKTGDEGTVVGSEGGNVLVCRKNSSGRDKFLFQPSEINTVEEWERKQSGKLVVGDVVEFPSLEFYTGKINNNIPSSIRKFVCGRVADVHTNGAISVDNDSGDFEFENNEKLAHVDTIEHDYQSATHRWEHDGTLVDLTHLQSLQNILSALVEYSNEISLHSLRDRTKALSSAVSVAKEGLETVKTSGNEFLWAEKYLQALKAYTNGVAVMEILSGRLPADGEDDLKTLHATFFGNRALCNLQLKKWQSAKSDASEALTLAKPDGAIAREAARSLEHADNEMNERIESEKAKKKARKKLAKQKKKAGVPDFLEQLVNAVGEHDSPAVSQLLAAGADPNAFVGEVIQTTALRTAALSGQPEVARLLLEGGADPDLADGTGSTSLMAAVGHGHLEVLQLLLARGAAVDAVDPDNSFTAFHLACYNNQPECVEELVRAGCDVGLKAKGGETGRQAAEQMGHVEVVVRLKELARRKKNAEMIKAMKEQAEVKSTRRHGPSPKTPKLVVKAEATSPMSRSNAARSLEQKTSPGCHPKDSADIDGGESSQKPQPEMKIVSLDVRLKRLIAELKNRPMAERELEAQATQLQLQSEPEPELKRGLEPELDIELKTRNQPGWEAQSELDPQPQQELEAERQVEPVAVVAVQELKTPLIDFEGLPWEILLTKAAQKQLRSLDRKMSDIVMKSIASIGEGDWSGNSFKRLETPHCTRLRLWECKFLAGARIIWEVGIDYSSRVKRYSDTIRIWSINVTHDGAKKSITNVIDNHNQGRTTVFKKHLKGITRRNHLVHEPILYDACTVDDGARTEPECESAGSDLASAGGQLQEQFPPAQLLDENRTLIKFYQMTNNLVEQTLAGVLNEKMDWPFRPDETESLIIELTPDPPCGILLLGRSGTGKTTIAVHRMCAMQNGLTMGGGNFGKTNRTEHLRMAFVTANPTLLSSVKRSVRALNHDTGSELEMPPTLRDISDEAFPLFLTSTAFIHMLDGTLHRPFFMRDIEGNITERVSDDGMHNEAGATTDLDDYLDLDSSDDEDSEDMEKGDEHSAPVAQRREVTYAFFEERIWPLICSKQLNTISKATASVEAGKAFHSKALSDFAPSVVWTEIISFIKGSSSSLDTTEGFLSRSQYVELPKKMAPAFAGQNDRREHVYDLFEKYQTARLGFSAYDAMDVTFHIYSEIQNGNYNGTIVHGFIIDEVQDFCQAQVNLCCCL
jgi:hypothetical protein